MGSAAVKAAAIDPERVARQGRSASWGNRADKHLGPGGGPVIPMNVILRHNLSTHLGLVVLVLALGGCATDRGRPPPVGLSLKVTPIVEAARRQLGVPYHPGGASPATGFDCSGFTQWVYQQCGIVLPRQSSDQYLAGPQVGRDQLQQGDLVFFEIEQKGASHVGIYEARGWFIHSSSTGGRVREDHLSGKYWQQHYLGACRPGPSRRENVKFD